MDYGSLTTCLYVTVLVLFLVIGIPIIDTLVCRKIGLNPVGGKNRTLASNRLYVVRRVLLFVGFAIYLVGFLYTTLFSRAAAADYKVHIDLFRRFIDNIIDFGVLGYILGVVSGGIIKLPSEITTSSINGITELYLNIMLFIPMGYFLPYLFKWFRRDDIKLKVTVASFLISLSLENIQLITKRGFYDIDDIVCNTLGGFLGGALFITFAFVVTHPDWRKERARYKRWSKNAKQRTLYPFAKNMTISRTFLRATDETNIWDFYVKKLGFRVVGQLIPEDSLGTVFLMELGNSQVEILCSNEEETLDRQTLIISVTKPDKVRTRLENSGIDVGPYTQDPFTGLNCFSFDAPDNVRVVILAQDE